MSEFAMVMDLLAKGYEVSYGGHTIRPTQDGKFSITTPDSFTLYPIRAVAVHVFIEHAHEHRRSSTADPPPDVQG